MKKTIKIAIIDDGIDYQYLNAIVDEKINICSMQVYKDGVCPQLTISNKMINHGTVCAALLVEFMAKTNDYFDTKIVSLSVNNFSNEINIKRLKIGLSWCIENDFDLVLMSLGNKNLVYAKSMIPILEKAKKQKVIMVAALSNEGCITYPACFDQVIGVKKMSASKEGDRLRVIENPKDGIEVLASFAESKVLKKIKQKYNIQYGSSNSWIVPYVGSYISQIIQRAERKDKASLLKLLASAQSGISFEVQSCDRDEYSCLSNDVPTVEIIYNPSTLLSTKQFILSLIQKFESEGYSCACLYDGCQRNIFELGIYSLSKNNCDKELYNYKAILSYNSLVVVMVNEHNPIIEDQIDLFLNVNEIIENSSSIYDEEVGKIFEYIIKKLI